MPVPTCCRSTGRRAQPRLHGIVDFDRDSAIGGALLQGIMALRGGSSLEGKASQVDPIRALRND